MLNSKSQKGNRMDSGNSQNRLGQGTEIEGDIVSDGGFRIDGVLKGSLKTPGKVVIGKEGKIIGTLESGSADIEGAFEGTMVIQDLLSLKSTASINGEVTTAKLMVEPGTEFNGTCSMNKGVKTMSRDASSKEKSGKTA